MIGTLGPVTFLASADLVKTLDGLKRIESARWAKHEVVGRKPVLEFIGPDTGSLTFTMRFDVALGVNPRKETDRLIRITRDGKVYHFILGKARFGMNKWAIIDTEIQFQRIDNRGNMLVSEVAVTLEEYV